jgi:hypothetical protein
MQAQLSMKRITFLQSCLYNESYGKLICCDSDHDGLNEVIFATGTIYSSNPLRWEVWEYRPNNRYELVFADTGAYPYPPGITTGNFRPYDVGDIDNDRMKEFLIYKSIPWRKGESDKLIINMSESILERRSFMDNYNFNRICHNWYYFAPPQFVNFFFYFLCGF